MSQESQLEAAYRQAMAGSFKRSLIMEEYIAGQEYAVEVLIVDALPNVLAISEKQVTVDRSCVELMDITPAPLESSRREKIEKFVAEIVKSFEVYNHLIHIEIRIDTNGACRIIEINPRPSGGNLLESIHFLFVHHPSPTGKGGVRVATGAGRSRSLPSGCSSLIGTGRR